MTAQPRRKKSFDRITHHGATAPEIECDMAIGPFDQAAREADKRWGVDRLPDLVSAETAARWGTAMANLNAAIDAQDKALVIARVNACLRGFAAMDAEATAAGHAPIVPEAWEFDVNGQTVALLRDMAAWPAYEALRPGVRIYSLREVALALGNYSPGVAEAKKHFPGAEVTAIRQPTPLEDDLNDIIPF